MKRFWSIGLTILILAHQGCLLEVMVPQVVNENIDHGIAEIKKVGLSCDVKYEHHDIVQKDKIITQSPIGGTKVKVGTSVILVVSKGPKPPTMVKVPRLIDLTLEEALDELSIRLLGNSIQKEFADKPDGVVIGQNEPEGKEVPIGTVIALTVSIEIAPGPIKAYTLVSNLVHGVFPLTATVELIGDKTEADPTLSIEPVAKVARHEWARWVLLFPSAGIYTVTVNLDGEIYSTTIEVEDHTTAVSGFQDLWADFKEALNVNDDARLQSLMSGKAYKQLQQFNLAFNNVGVAQLKQVLGTEVNPKQELLELALGTPIEIMNNRCTFQSIQKVQTSSGPKDIGHQVVFVKAEGSLFWVIEIF